MGEKIVVGPVNKGLRTDRTPFVIDNDSFPMLINAYQWRGRVKRKRGTSLLGRLRRYIGTTDGAGALVVTISPNPITSTSSSFVVGSNVFTDPGGASPVVLLTNGPGTATLNRTTGVLTIAGSNANTSVIYYPTLPVMGLEDLALQPTQDIGNIGFDTKYSYNINTTQPYNIYDVSFYKNPQTGTYAGYTQKGTWTRTWWNGQDYQQFWTTNYQGAFWATNGITVPFSISNVGMQYSGVTNVAAPVGNTVDITVTGANLVVGDFVFLNEFDPAIVTGINFQTGYVTAGSSPGVITITLPNATLAGAGGATTSGIVQYLTNRSDTTKDCIRWYDGDPTDGNATSPTMVTGKGWVNFCPPLSQSNFSIVNLKAAKYYLVGARMIVPFKDRLLFIGPVIQTSSAGSQVYLQDTIIYSQNGTPFYSASYTNTPSATVDTPTSPTNVFNPILVSSSQSTAASPQTATPYSFFGDSTGFGGFITAGVDQPIITVSSNEDVLILGFSNIQARLVYTGNDIIPFNIFLINSEFGSTSTFSAINMDRGVISKGSRGYIISSQTAVERIDPAIPDQVFEVRLLENGNERVCAQRDFLNEWIYFTYPSNEISYKFPTQTLQYNYADDSWAIFNETYTTYGLFRKKTGFTWATIGTVYPTWSSWTTPWNSGTSTLLQPNVIAGNQQGFILVRDDGTNEGNSLYIQNISGSTVTSPNHCLVNGDYIVISGCLGTNVSQVNGQIFSIANATTDTFTLNPNLSSTDPITYTGGGVIKRMYVPFIQTRQFPVSWGLARKTRLGPQQYLLSRTNNGQITLQIYLSQNDDNPFNAGTIVPTTSTAPQNSSLIYSSILYTCPESTNLGLTPANTNLQMLTQISSAGVSSNNQQQIWHRINTSLIGDTVQLGFTLSDSQMRDTNFSNQFVEIELHGFILDVSPSQVLS